MPRGPMRTSGRAVGRRAAYKRCAARGPRGDSNLQDVGRFTATGTAHDFELDSLAFVERPESGALDGAEMNVDVRTLLVLGCDEPVTLLVVEILDRATRHGCSSLAG